MPTLTLLYVLFAITIVIALILFVGILGIVRPNNWLICFARWLKGSRKIYYIDSSGQVNFSSASRSYVREWTKGLMIEISRGPFRRRTAIYGQALKNWKISKASLGLNAQGGFGADWVDLVDCSGLPVEQALHIINKYPYFHAFVLDNANKSNLVAELESRPTQLELQAAKDNLFLANERREEWNAGVTAVLKVINNDRQYFRSKAAENIRRCLETLVEGQKDHHELEAGLDNVLRWEKDFHKLVYY